MRVKVWGLVLSHDIIPTSVGITLREVAELYKNNIWKLYGIPRKIILDRGPLSSIDSLGPIQTNTDQLEPPLHLFPRLGLGVQRTFWL